MHSYNYILVLLLSFLLFTTYTYSQIHESKVIVMNYYKFTFPDEVSVPEFDSLTYLYQENVLGKNELILSYKILRHWWGNRDKEFIIMFEVKSWDDVIKASQRNNELFEEHWNTQEEREKFNEAYNKYFNAKFPDETYREVTYE
jgi:hypothetical protein